MLWVCQIVLKLGTAWPFGQPAAVEAQDGMPRAAAVVKKYAVR